MNEAGKKTVKKRSLEKGRRKNNEAGKNEAVFKESQKGGRVG